MSSETNRALRGALAGVAGAAALAPTDRWERRLLGRPPAFAVDAITRRLLERVLDRTPARRTVKRVSRLFRLGYAMSLGSLVALSRVSALPAAAAIAGVELLALPATGATPPLRRWSGEEVALLFVHTAVFALTASGLLRLSARLRPGRTGLPPP